MNPIHGFFRENKNRQRNTGKLLINKNIDTFSTYKHSKRGFNA